MNRALPSPRPHLKSYPPCRYRELQLTPSKQMEAVCSCARMESQLQLDELLAQPCSSHSAKISRLKTIIGSLEARERSTAMAAMVNRAYNAAVGSKQELIDMVTSASGDEGSARVAADEDLKESMGRAKAVFMDFALRSLLSSHLASFTGLLPPEPEKTLLGHLHHVLQYVRAGRDAGDSRPRHRHDISDLVGSMKYSARHASQGFRAIDKEGVVGGDTSTGATGRQSEAITRQTRKSERRNRSTLFSTMFRSSVVLPPADVARYLERESQEHLVSTSMARVSGVVVHLTFFYNDSSDVVKLHAAIAPDVHYFLFLPYAAVQVNSLK